MTKLWHSGVILSAAGLLAGLGNYGFQAIMGHCLDKAEFGYVNSTLGFIGLLGLPLVIVSTSITHYIAHFRATGDEARLLQVPLSPDPGRLGGGGVADQTAEQLLSLPSPRAYARSVGLRSGRTVGRVCKHIVPRLGLVRAAGFHHSGNDGVEAVVWHRDGDQVPRRGGWRAGYGRCFAGLPHVASLAERTGEEKRSRIPVEPGIRPIPCGGGRVGHWRVLPHAGGFVGGPAQLHRAGPRSLHCRGVAGTGAADGRRAHADGAIHLALRPPDG